jgi:hypothetical protein
VGIVGAPSLGIKWLGCEAAHSPLSDTRGRNAWSYRSTSAIGILGIHRDSFTFHLFHMQGRAGKKERTKQIVFSHAFAIAI